MTLGITIDKKLTFKRHVENLCRKAQHKLHALRRIRKFLTIEKAKMLGNAFIDSQLNYAPLLWVFCRKTIYSKIEKIHHTTLKLSLNQMTVMKTYCYKVTRSHDIKDILDF